jgi:hypothetical protein
MALERKTKMALTPERKAEIRALLNPTKPPKPKVVTSEGDVIRDAVVRVAPEDPNARGRDDRVVNVRRADWVTINIAAWEEQQRWKAEDRRRRRELDPFRIGHWGPLDDNGDE